MIEKIKENARAVMWSNRGNFVRFKTIFDICAKFFKT
jgi:DNA-binding Xre family transcriptional regulator